MKTFLQKKLYIYVIVYKDIGMTQVSGIGSYGELITEYAKMAYQAINRGARPVETPQQTQTPQRGGFVGGFSGHPALNDQTFIAAIKNNPHINGTEGYGVSCPNPTYNSTQLGMGGISGREVNYIC